MWPFDTSFFSSTTKRSLPSESIDSSIEKFKEQLAVLQLMDKQIMVASMLAAASYLAGYSLCLAACSSFLTVAIARRIAFYPNYRAALDELISLYKQQPNDANQIVLTATLQPFLSVNNQADSWFFRLYGEASVANPLRPLLSPLVWQGVDAAVDLAFPARP